MRTSVFETNSSSTHSLSMCEDKVWVDWAQGKILYDKYDGRLVSIEVAIEESSKYSSDEHVAGIDIDRFITKEQFFTDGVDGNETFADHITTSSGETIHAFGHFGYN